MSELLGGTSMDSEQREYNHFISLNAGAMLQVRRVCLSCHFLLHTCALTTIVCRTQIVNDVLDFSKIQSNRVSSLACFECVMGV